MSIAAPPRRYTAADLLAMPDGDRYELVDGELVELETSNESSWIAGEIYRRIANWGTEKSVGWAFPDNTGYRCFPWDEDRVRKPDASFITKQRLPEGPLTEGYCPVAPDLAVEVISPNDLYVDVETKVLEYLRIGVQAVWLVTPSTRTVMVYHRDDPSPLHLMETDEITGGSVLPGFRCRVAEFFPPRPATAAK